MMADIFFLIIQVVGLLPNNQETQMGARTKSGNRSSSSCLVNSKSWVWLQYCSLERPLLTPVDERSSYGVHQVHPDKTHSYYSKGPSVCLLRSAQEEVRGLASQTTADSLPTQHRGGIQNLIPSSVS
jgi:hypothetical protein